MSEIETLVDSFVFHINRHARRPLGPEAPPSVRVNGLIAKDRYPWVIKSYPDIDWIAPLERRLGVRISRYYRPLVGRWIFPSFSVNLGKTRLVFLGNTPEGTDERELRVELTRNNPLVDNLLERGFFPFAIADDYRGNDPLCFDLNRRLADRDYPVVRVDRVLALDKGRIWILGEWAPSFRQLMLSIMRGAERND